MIILDTDTCIEILRGNEGVILRRERSGAEVGLSFMTACELFYGACESSKPDYNKRLVEEFLLTLETNESNRSIEVLFGQIKAELQAKGEPVADADILIAATAMSMNAILVTGNSRQYRRIDGLKIENWMSR